MMVRSARCVAFCVALLVAWAASAQTPEPTGKRKALLIGLSTYDHLGPLPGAEADTIATEAFLAELQFDQIDRLPPRLGYVELMTAIDAFVTAINPGDEVYVHFSGHGVQIDRRNGSTGYLLASDAPAPGAATASVLSNVSLPVQKLVSLLEESGALLSVIIIDACRDSPYPQTNKIRGGPAGVISNEDRKVIDETGNVFVILSARPPQKALDYDPLRRAETSLFTTELLINARDKVRSFEQVASQTRDAVTLAANRQNHAQNPEIVARITRCFNLWKGYGEACVAQQARSSAEADDRARWVDITVMPYDEQRCQALRDFETDFPKSKFAAAARAELDRPPCGSGTVADKSFKQLTERKIFGAGMSPTELVLANFAYQASQKARLATARATEAESLGRIRASSAASGLTGCRDAGYLGDCRVPEAHYGEESYGGRSQGESFAGLFEGRIRKLGAFVYPVSRANSSNVARYDGEFAPDERNNRGNWNGLGTATYFDGTVYRGEFSLGMKHGYGEETRPDGTIVLGQWKDDVLTSYVARSPKGVRVEFE